MVYNGTHLDALLPASLALLFECAAQTSVTESRNERDRTPPTEGGGLVHGGSVSLVCGHLQDVFGWVCVVCFELRTWAALASP